MSKTDAVRALKAELKSLHKLQEACQTAIMNVPHQKDCARQVHDAAECTCIRASIITLEETLDRQLS